MRTHSTRLVRGLLLLAGLALAGPAAATPPRNPSHGNTKFEPGNALIRTGEARAAIGVKANSFISANTVQGASARKVRKEDIYVNGNGEWVLGVKQKRTGKTLYHLTGTIDLKAPTKAQIEPLAHDLYLGRKDATPGTDWNAAQAKLKKQGIAQPTDEKTGPLANKLSKQRTQLGDWQKAERQLRRSADRVQITPPQAP